MAGQFERHGDVFQRRHVGDQVEGLEHDADIPAAKSGDPSSLMPVRGSPAIVIRPNRPFQPGQHHQQRRLAGPGRPHDAGRLPGMISRSTSCSTSTRRRPGQA
jgi:hypothetical protein